MEKSTPLAVFAYNRPQHLQKTLEALGHCWRIDECDVYIFCDGLKNPEQKALIDETRKVAHAWAETNNAKVIERTSNLGLSESITSTVSNLCHEYGRVIVVEDDLIVSPFFVDFMIQALDRYEKDEKVFQVGGFLFTKEKISKTDAFLQPVSTTWGWATWARAWKYFKRNPEEAKDKLQSPEIRYHFDLENTYPYTQMLLDNIAGKNQSWGIWWWWTVFNKKGLVVYPSLSLVYNNGFDNSGINCGNTDRNSLSIQDIENFEQRKQIVFPSDTTINLDAYSKYKKSIKDKPLQPSTVKMTLHKRISDLLRKLHIYGTANKTKGLFKMIRYQIKKIRNYSGR